MPDLTPIAYECALRCSAADAFDAYTARIGEWWDARYTASPRTLQTVTIEPRLGGRVYATHTDIGEHEWGEVVVWEPGRRLVHTFALAQDPQYPTQVALEFRAADEGGCTVLFSHGGWSARNATAREKFGDWRIMLDRFAALADAES